jgi:hypothetical protein
MNKGEAAYVNTLLRWLLGIDGDPEQARWAATRLAERAHTASPAAVSAATVQNLWDEREPSPYALPALLAAFWQADQGFVADAAESMRELTEGLLDAHRYTLARPEGSDAWTYTQLYEHARDHGRDQPEGGPVQCDCGRFVEEWERTCGQCGRAYPAQRDPWADTAALAAAEDLPENREDLLGALQRSLAVRRVLDNPGGAS